MVSVLLIAVEVVLPVILRNLIRFSLNGKGCLSNAVCAWSDNRSEKAVIVQIVLTPVKAQYNICQLPSLSGTQSVPEQLPDMLTSAHMPFCWKSGTM